LAVGAGGALSLGAEGVGEGVVGAFSVGAGVALCAGAGVAVCACAWSMQKINSEAAVESHSRFERPDILSFILTKARIHRHVRHSERATCRRHWAD
jgi:hypothetical protein